MGEHAYDHSSMSPSTPAAQAQHKGSSRHHTTTPSSKITTTTRPAIRIIHIVAPEIIKTDAANFRDLVQRLTGKQQQQQPAAADHDVDRKAVTVAVAPTPPSPVEEKPQKKRLAAAELADDLVVQQENMRKKKIKCEVVKLEEGGFGDLDLGELWMDLNPGGFLSFLEEDVFHFQGMAPPEFSQTPLGLGAPRMDLIGEMCASYLA